MKRVDSISKYQKDKLKISAIVRGGLHSKLNCSSPVIQSSFSHFISVEGILNGNKLLQADQSVRRKFGNCQALKRLFAHIYKPCHAEALSRDRQKQNESTTIQLECLLKNSDLSTICLRYLMQFQMNKKHRRLLLLSLPNITVLHCYNHDTM